MACHRCGKVGTLVARFRSWPLGLYEWVRLRCMNDACAVEVRDRFDDIRFKGPYRATWAIPAREYVPA